MRRSVVLVSIAAGAVLTSTLAVAPAAQATATTSGPMPVECPAALATTSAVAGLVGTGWTVERGTTPEPFTATVLGRVTNGIAPGVDMIMAELSSPALTRAGGVWAGMSGSPVYTSGGQLIGSVSYGLAASSPIAGITPAASLGTLLSADPDDASTRHSRIVPDGRAVQRLTATGEVTARQAASGFGRLPMPLSVSGLTGPSTDTMLHALQRKTGQRVLSGAASASGTASPATIVGGGNFSAAVAYGDATLSAVGTTTYTCHGKAVAFGHPFLDTGVTTYSAHAAGAVYVQPDKVRGPFKVANTGGVVGVVDRDRTLGIRATLGAAPRGTQITSTLRRVENGLSRTGRTTAVYEPLLSTAAAVHTMANVDKVMGSSASRGTARVNLTVTGKRSSGAPFTVRVGQIFTTQVGDEPLDLLVASWVDDNVGQLVDQPFEDVAISTVSLTGTLSSQAATWVSPHVQYSKFGRYGTYPHGLVMTAGKALHTRTTFSLYRTPSTPGTLRVSVPVPSSARGHDVEVTVTGGTGDDFDGFFGLLLGSGAGPDVAEPASFPQVIAGLQSAPRADEVTVAVKDADSGRVFAEHTVRANREVAPFEETNTLLVR